MNDQLVDRVLWMGKMCLSNRSGMEGILILNGILSGMRYLQSLDYWHKRGYANANPPFFVANITLGGEIKKIDFIQ